MNGKTHKMVGVAVGVSMATYGLLSGQPEMMMGLVTAPLGAMLPDIDHNSTRMGRTRKKAVGTAKVIAVGAAVLLLAIVIRRLLGGAQYVKAFSLILMLCGSLAILSAVAKIPAVQKTFRFVTRHRGIMHTLLVPVLCIYGAFSMEVAYVSMLLLGIGFGYASHLLADCLTADGCPLLWPITTKCISVMHIKCGSTGEYVAGAILCGGVICLALILK